MRSPLGRVHILSAVPTGSGNRATSRSPCAMPSTRLSFSVNLSTKAAFKPFSFAALMSRSLAARICALCAISASAIARSALFRSSMPHTAISSAAARAFLPNSNTDSAIFIASMPGNSSIKRKRGLRSWRIPFRQRPNSAASIGAEGGARTRTEFPPRDFKSRVSAIPPLRHLFYFITLRQPSSSKSRSIVVGVL